MSFISGGRDDEEPEDAQVVDLAAKAKEDVKVRKCLMCPRSFTSSWRGNRICKRCKVIVRKRQGSTDEHDTHF